MAVNLVLAPAALVQELELEEGADVGALAGEGDEDRDVGRVVLGVLPVGVEVNRPLVPADGEVLAGDVLAHAHALGERVPLDREPVGAVDGLGQRLRRRRRHQRAGARVRGRIHRAVVQARESPRAGRPVGERIRRGRRIGGARAGGAGARRDSRSGGRANLNWGGEEAEVEEVGR